MKNKRLEFRRGEEKIEIGEISNPSYSSAILRFDEITERA